MPPKHFRHALPRARFPRRRRVLVGIAAFVTLPLALSLAISARASETFRPDGAIAPVGAAAAAPVQSAQSPAADPAATTTAGCTMSAILVPSCGAWWGVSPGGSGTASTEVAEFERLTGERTDIFHGYHQFGDMFPSASERDLARSPQGKRLLLFSLMPTSGGRTWAQVASGAQDAYLAQLASYIKTNFPEKFFITLHHEPENDVIPRAGSGMQATDFRDMFRHVVTKMKSLGVNNVVWVVTYQGVQSYKLDSWWPSLYPGDDVVDWIAWDIYSCVAPAPGQPCIDFSQMMNRRYSNQTPWVGMYNWATANHPGKPLMIPEFGVYDVGGTRKATVLTSIGQQVNQFPAIKAIVYWNSGTGKKSMIQYGQGAVAAARWSATQPWTRQSVG
ncbi:MAG: hypothetical protein ABI083_13055 [Lapillicoccus sp.]